MTIQRDTSGRLQIDSPFMGESMMDKSLLASTDTGPIYRLMPDLIVVKIGGQSIIDRGREALMPILDELVAARSDPQNPDHHRRRHARPACLCHRH